MYLLSHHWNPKDKGGKFHYNHLTDEADREAPEDLLTQDLKRLTPKPRFSPHHIPFDKPFNFILIASV